MNIPTAYVTQPQAAEMLGMKPHTLRQYRVDTGTPRPAFRVNQCPLFSIWEVLAVGLKRNARTHSKGIHA